MKIFASVMIAAAVMLFVGCSDQSGMTDPLAGTANNHGQLAKPKSEFPVDLKLIGPDGTKYEVTGVIKYTYLCDDKSAVLTTDALLDVAIAGTGDVQKVIGGRRFEFTREPQGINIVAEAFTIGSSSEGGSQVEVQYSAEELGVRLVDIAITDGTLPRVVVAAAH
jgi:hypothetical protein